MSLTSCIKKAGKALAAEHKAALFAKAREYRTQGLTGDDAGKRAVQEQIELVGTLISEQTQLANQPAIGGVVPAAPEAAKPPTGIDQAADQAATSPKNDLPQPTGGQKEAGNYPKGHHKIGGLDISIENPAGSERSGVDKAGKPWKNTLKHHYGYFKGTIGNDKDHVDVFIKPGTPDDFSGQVFVIDQFDGDKFDEHKVVMGAQTGLEARQIYQANYAKGWTGGKSVTAMPFDEFKAWVKDGAKNKPVAGQNAAKEPSLDDLNSGKAFVDNTKAKIAEWVSKATNNSTREIDKKWERAAVKRFIDANIKTMLDGKQTGNRATAKIAIGKSETFAQLAAAVEKFATPSVNLSASAQPAPKTPEIGQDQTASTSSLLGRDSQPVSEGGKPFKTMKEAKKEKKRQPLMRVISSPDGKGFVLAEKTEKQLAAEKKASRRLSGVSTGEGGPESAHTFIMSKGGLNKLKMADLGFDQNPRFGNRTLFAGTGGLTMADAMELLHEAGFISEETESAARSVIQKSANGQPQYTPEGWEVVAEKEEAERRQAYDDEQKAIALEQELTDNELDAAVAAFELAMLDMPQGLAQSDMTMDEALLAAGFTTEEIDNEQDSETDESAAETATGESPQADSGSQGAPGQEEGLTAPTRQDIEAQQDRAENAPALDDKAQIDREAAGQTLTRPTAPEQRRDTTQDIFGGPTVADAERAREVERKAQAEAQAKKDKESGQGGMFDEPQAPAIQAAEILNAANVTGKERIDALKDVKSGTITPAELKEAYPAEDNDALIEKLKPLVDDRTGGIERMAGDAKKELRREIATEALGRKAKSDEISLTAIVTALVKKFGGDPDAMARVEQERFLRKTVHPKDNDINIGSEENPVQIDGREGYRSDGFWNLKSPQGGPLGGKFIRDYNSERNAALDAEWAAKAQPITPDQAANLTRGAIVKDSKGVEYYAWSARFDRLDVMPMKDGKPVVHAGSAIRFALTDTAREANPDYLADPLYLVSEPESKPVAKIEDSGEVLEGARKLYAKAYQAKLDESMGVDIASVPLSKSWPEPDYQKLIDAGADPWTVAFAHAARDEVPTKPVKAWKLKGWVEKVQTLREMTTRLMEGASPTYSKEAIIEKLKTVQLQNLQNKVDLYEAMGHENSLKEYSFTKGNYGMYAGQTFDPPKVLWAITHPSKSASATWSHGNWGHEIAVADTKEQAIEKFKAWSESQGEKAPEAAKGTVFDIYSYRSKPGVVIVGKRLTANKSIDLKTFATVQKARAYKTANQAELEALLAKEKYEPPERRENNAPRVGIDHRNGADVTTEQFRETFGFRGEQFGASMPNSERQSNLNQAYDALMDLAGVIGIPPKALSLNGELGLAFGARGRGGKNAPMAHYEADVTGEVTPSLVVINLTRKNGAGSLAHEWFHATDNYFARMRGDKGEFVTMHPNEWRGEGVRPEMIVAFKELMKTINLTGIQERSKVLDNKRTKDYWGTGLEMAARSFESYVIAKLQDQNASNDYLANIVNETLYALQGAYPYPSMGEMPQIRAAFDHFFDTVQTKETDQGVAMFSRADPFYSALTREVGNIPAKAQSGASQQSKAAVVAIINTLKAKWKNAPDIVVVSDMQDPAIPERVRVEDLKQRSGGAKGTPEGFYYGGIVYLVSSQMKNAADVQRVLFHETLGHAGLRGTFGDGLTPILKQIAMFRKAEVDAKIEAYGLKKDSELDRLVAAEEVLAVLAQTRPELGFVKRAIAAIRTWLRENGFTSLAMTDDEIINNLILPARAFVEGSAQGGQTGEARLSRSTSQTDTPAFKAWFKGSKVVNPDGSPLVVYHGTYVDFDEFASGSEGLLGAGIYFTKTPSEASMYAGMEPTDTGGRVMPVYLSLKNPAPESLAEDIEPEHGSNTSNVLQEMGYDGIIGKDTVVAFNPAQIKSAIGNNGNFDPTNPDIRFSLSDSLNNAANSAKDLNIGAGYLVGDLMNAAPGKLNWWHKTVGTQYNLAQRYPAFKRVFDGVQNFINDVSYYATESANLAPNILPKLEHFKDIWKSPMKAEDAKAIKAPIFEGTLVWMRDDVTGEAVKVKELKGIYAKRNADRATRNAERRAKYPELEWTLAKKKKALVDGGFLDGKTLTMWEGQREGWIEKVIEGKFEKDVMGIEEMEIEPTEATPGIVFTPNELKSMFNLTGKRDANGKWDGQIGLYQEYRAATNQSLSNLAISDMLRFGGDDVAVMRERALAAKTVDEAANLLAEHLRELAELIPEREAVLTNTADKMITKGDRATDLMKRGYAPLSRFGPYTLDVVENGERVYFGMFESKWEAAKMRREMEETFPEATIQQGTVSEEAYKMFAGVSPETLELFGDMLGLESSGNAAKDQAFQTYLKAAKSTRSAMKRLIERKGIAGFNEDAGRVLAGFVTSNARQTSSNLHMGEVTQAAADKDAFRNQGELQDQAVKLVEYIKNPQEEAQAIRGLLFAQYIGGSIASAMVNMTQPITMTFPWLSQYGGAAKAVKQMTAAMKDSTKAVIGDKALDAALKRAEEDGTVSPQEVHQLQAQSMGRGVLKTGDGTTAGDAMAKASNTLSRVSLAWGKLFGAAEQFNRKVTFIAAYRTAVEQGIRDPDAFARKAVVETQGIYCVDDQTECLTASGWKFHSQLQPGEKLYAVNETGTLVESELMDIHRFTGNIAATEFRNSNGFSMVLTDDHTCLVQNYNSRDKKFQRIMRVKAKDVKIGHHFLRTPTGSEVKRTAVYTDDEVALFAWVAAEGHLFAHRGVKEKRGVGLVQSQRHNPQYVVEIDALLDRLGGHYNRKTSRAGEMVCWQLRKPLWLKIHEALPGKLISFDLVEKLTVRQMALFLEVFVKGDGHIPKFGGPIIAQKDIGNLDALQAMTVLSGKSSTIYPRMGESDCGALSIAKNSKRAYRKEMTATRVALEMAWCPETTHGTWIARRNGRTFITGNSKGNKPEWARGAIGGTLFTFKQFSVAYVEMISRMAKSGPEGKKAALLALGVLFLLSGAGGLPGADDLDDLISGLLQSMGYNFDSKSKRREFFAGILGEGGAQFMERGISGIAGVPIDISGRLGMGNLIPGTGLFTKKPDHTRDVAELAGPAGDLAKRGFEAAGQLVKGEVGGAVKSVSPKAIQNMAQSYDMATMGMYRDQSGKKVIDTDGADALSKFIGFQPNDVKKVQDATRETQRMIGLNKIRETEIADKWAKGIFEKDPAKVREARDELAEWNEMNPDSPIRIKFTQILQRTRKMNQTKAERIAATAPKEIRAQVRRELTQ